MLVSLQGQYVALACSRHGSRVLDAIWSGAALGARKEIAAELGEYQHLSLTFLNFPHSRWLSGWGGYFNSAETSVPKGGIGHGFLAVCPPPLLLCSICSPVFPPSPGFRSLETKVLIVPEANPGPRENGGTFTQRVFL